MKKYIYFQDGRYHYDGECLRWEDLPVEKMPRKYLPYKMKNANFEYPEKIMKFLSFILDDVSIGIFTFYFAQVFNGKIEHPIFFYGKPKTGKTILLNLIYDIFYPLVSFQVDLHFNRFKHDNKCLFVNKKPIIREVNTLPKYKKHNRIIEFKNVLSGVEIKGEYLEELRAEYPCFISYMLFRYEDFIDDIEDARKKECEL